MISVGPSGLGTTSPDSANSSNCASNSSPDHLRQGLEWKCATRRKRYNTIHSNTDTKCRIRWDTNALLGECCQSIHHAKCIKVPKEWGFSADLAPKLKYTSGPRTNPSPTESAPVRWPLCRAKATSSPEIDSFSWTLSHFKAQTLKRWIPGNGFALFCFLPRHCWIDFNDTRWGLRLDPMGMDKEFPKVGASWSAQRDANKWPWANARASGLRDTVPTALMHAPCFDHHCICHCMSSYVIVNSCQLARMSHTRYHWCQNMLKSTHSLHEISGLKLRHQICKHGDGFRNMDEKLQTLSRCKMRTTQQCYFLSVRDWAKHVPKWACIQHGTKHHVHWGWHSLWHMSEGCTVLHWYFFNWVALSCFSALWNVPATSCAFFGHISYPACSHATGAEQKATAPKWNRKPWGLIEGLMKKWWGIVLVKNKPFDAQLAHKKLLATVHYGSITSDPFWTSSREAGWTSRFSKLLHSVPAIKAKLQWKNTTTTTDRNM